MTMFKLTPIGSTMVVDMECNSHAIPAGYSIRVMASGSYPSEAELTSALSRDLGMQLKPVYIGAWRYEKV